ncbi:MAG: hypothetical protein M5U23_11265 [Acidimicrobiia bacterium]|nr:hypothetical protein [Acidimicrobiia bacterium]
MNDSDILHRLAAANPVSEHGLTIEDATLLLAIEEKSVAMSKNVERRATRGIPSLTSPKPWKNTGLIFALAAVAVITVFGAVAVASLRSTDAPPAAPSTTGDVPEPRTTFTMAESPIVLTIMGSDFRDTCVAAADLLGFAVPCPHTIPFQTGSQYCRPSNDDQDTPCVSSGTFMVELSGSRSLDAQKVLSHFVIEASRFDPVCDDPTVIRFGKYEGSLVECGGGIHHDSVAFTWNEDGVYYTVSARGDRETAIDAIGIVVQDIEMVEPMNTTG